ncbi:hypothetical protein E2542_SST03770 [Spatholobus suberectus]|nr:hypothetical protein E2542_SST03770 [Spatholobus suberectus]
MQKKMKTTQEHPVALQRSYMMKNYVAFVMMNNATASLFPVDIVPLAMIVHREADGERKQKGKSTIDMDSYVI